MMNNYDKHSYNVNGFTFTDFYHVIRDGIRKTSYYAKDLEGAKECVNALAKKDLKNKAYAKYIITHFAEDSKGHLAIINEDGLTIWTSDYETA